MLPTEDLFVHIYVLIDDAITCRAIDIGPHRRDHRRSSPHARLPSWHRSTHITRLRRG